MHPAKTVGRKEMPFARNTRVVPSNIVLDGGPGIPTGRGDLGNQIGIGTPGQNLHCKLRPDRTRSGIVAIDNL